MAEVRTNMFTVHRKYPLRDGVPFGEGMRLVHVNNEPQVYFSDTFGIRLGSRATDPRPTLSPDRERLLRARPVQKGPTKYHLIAAPDNYHGIVVRIVSDNLRFGIAPLANDLNLWPGGDGDIPPFVQQMKPIRDELFELAPGRWLFIVDEVAAVARLENVGGVPELREPTCNEVIDFLVKRAQSENHVRAYDWALGNLRSLQTGGHITRQSRDAINILQRHRNSLSVRA